MEGSTLYNSLNFSVEYNDLSGCNFTGASAVVNGFLCPSTARQFGNGNRDSFNASNSPEENIPGNLSKIGYGYTDYAPSVYTDINVVNGVLSTGGVGSTTIVPYRNKNVAAKGLLKDGQTSIAEITDGTSNTAMILECAGRDESYVSQYVDGYLPLRGQGVPAGLHRYWRWADPGNAFGTSGSPNNKGIPSHEAGAWPTSSVTAGNQAGANEEPYSFHRGGVNVLYGDGTVRFVKDSVNLVAWRGVLTLAGGETVSSDSY
jgi:prepilin-type processing-associated H-X9-DG protein